MAKASQKTFVTEDQGGPVECLGMTFPNDQARREYFSAKLKEKLQDPEFRKLEGFPIGDDEDILAMSDPPYYTACPNPFIEEFLRTSGSRKAAVHEYHREPFTTDVSEGKSDGLYSAHAYHTKVPHKAIVRYALHYTEPGDVILDGFSGSGMTGVAAQMCGCADADFCQEVETECRASGYPTPKWGERRVILSDLSPVATFISANYNIPVDLREFQRVGATLLTGLQEHMGQMYETLHQNCRTKGRINYTVWSEVFRCQHCGSEVVFLEQGLDDESKKVKDSFPCPKCAASLTKRGMERVWRHG